MATGLGFGSTDRHLVTTRTPLASRAVLLNIYSPGDTLHLAFQRPHVPPDQWEGDTFVAFRWNHEWGDLVVACVSRKAVGRRSRFIAGRREKGNRYPTKRPTAHGLHTDHASFIRPLRPGPHNPQWHSAVPGLGTACFIPATARLLIPCDFCLEPTPSNPYDLYLTCYLIGPSSEPPLAPGDPTCMRVQEP